MHDAIDRFRLMLSVVPVQGNLYAKRSCDIQYTTTPPVCKTVIQEEKCLEMVIPVSHFVPTRICSTCYTTGCPASACTFLPGDGVPDADFVVYVKAVTTTQCGPQVLAYASACQRDQFDRPTFGMVNFCPLRVSSDPVKYESQLSTALHEISHALGFSSQFYAYMRHKDGTPRTRRDQNNRPPALVNTQCPNGKYVNYYSNPDTATVQYYTERDELVAKMVTPAVAKFVQTHFNCSSLTGAELENLDDGCLGSHWEERLFEPEYMTPVLSYFTVISGLTMAFFEDSGWYKTNSSMTAQLDFGAGLGCPFAQKKCVDQATQTPLAVDHYCTVNDAESCTPDATSRSFCSIGTGKTIPWYFQYFDDPTVGGYNPYADFCPLNTGFLKGDCTITTNMQLQYPVNTTINLMGETYCPTCRCTKSSLVLLNSGWITSPRRKSGCYAMDCATPNAVTISVQVSDDVYKVNCTKKGALITIPNFSGTLTCPDPAVVCEKRCPRACSGHGVCNFVSQTCSCSAGWSGSDCATVAPVGGTQDMSSNTTDAATNSTSSSGSMDSTNPQSNRTSLPTATTPPTAKVTPIPTSSSATPPPRNVSIPTSTPKPTAKTSTVAPVTNKTQNGANSTLANGCAANVSSQCATTTGQALLSNDMGETYCESCMCTRSSLHRNASTTLTRPWGCYAIQCLSSSLLQMAVTSPNLTYKFNCTAGKPVDVAIPGYMGTVACIDPQTVCDFTCPNNCSSHGTCQAVTRKCVCAVGWTGSDCATASPGTNASAHPSPTASLRSRATSSIKSSPGLQLEVLALLVALVLYWDQATIATSTPHQHTAQLTPRTMLVDKRREVLRLYREILRTTRQFEWKNEQAELWSTVLRKNARSEIENARHETDSETISKRIIIGWDCVAQVQQKMVEKQQELQQQATSAPPSNDSKNAS
ncbi:TPA: hypothetical protein N0F65_009309 [Lagenidium giganteum]|uniref:EGF-like domain-containing protein n=1 Tax=Lagenidium giganteum TaxID=4803 RepID=A0AAV2YV41_9STRA|nr:TPA: hypothetical protein N0F65_009309 [Lagenidium giganteum]